MTTHLPVLEAQSRKGSVGADGKRSFVYPADVRGRFTSFRKFFFLFLIAFFAGLPWIQVNGNPAIYLDIPGRRFFVLGMTFNAQDVWMMVFVITGGAFGLVYTAALAGRAWCAYACPQTVFLEAVFRRIERFIEGPREKRMRRAQALMTFDKAWRKVLVHAAYALAALLIAHAFLSYFVSVRQLFHMVRHHPMQHPEAFMVVMGLSGVLYFNFAWFRELFCVMICPYGRLQSVLLDSDSIVVGYDTKRGEPRGKVKDKNRGACIDCDRCVVVCPTSIDIRTGLQMDCIGCTQCIDACDEIMDKLGQPRGLIRYDSLNGLAGKPKRIIRARIIIYSLLGLLGLVVATFALSSHKTFECNLLRVQGAPYVVDDGQVRNMYRVHLFNKEGRETTYHIEPEPVSGITFTVPMQDIHLDSLGNVDAPLFASLPEDAFHGALELRIRVRNDLGASRVVTAPFLGPAHHGVGSHERKEHGEKEHGERPRGGP
jgi:cytochrome c oxidase accessory protein FixG